MSVWPLAADPGFMKSNCMKACDACPPALYEGKQATALVRNAWDEEFDGLATAVYVAKHVEPHEARVLVITFGERAELEKRLKDEHERQQQSSSSSATIATADDTRDGHVAAVSSSSVGDAASISHSLSGQEMAHIRQDGEPPTISVCVSEHMDTLLLALGAPQPPPTCLPGYLLMCRARRAPFETHSGVTLACTQLLGRYQVASCCLPVGDATRVYQRLRTRDRGVQAKYVMVYQGRPMTCDV